MEKMTELVICSLKQTLFTDSANAGISISVSEWEK